MGRAGPWLALAAAMVFGPVALPALAQDPTPAEAEASNVTPYPASFFEEYRPITAMDMLGHIPGFSFDGGSDARGFSGNAGNVLIDGQRPASRSDSLFDVVARISASSVQRIDLIRGGAPGIDMQGKPIVANIIRKTEADLSGSFTAHGDINERGQRSGGGNIQAQRRSGSQVLDGSLRFDVSHGIDESARIKVDPLGDIEELAHNRGEFPYDEIRLTGAYETPFLGGSLRLNGEGGVQHHGYRFVDLLLIPGGQTLDQNHHTFQSGEAGVHWSRTLPKGITLDLVGFQSLGKYRDAGKTMQIDFTSDSGGTGKEGESIGSINLHSPALGSWKIDGGTELAFNWTEDETVRTIDGARVVLPGDRTRVEELRNESNLSTTWTVSKTMNVEAGVRYERSTISSGPVENNLGYLKPRVIVSWTPKPGHQFTYRLQKNVDQLSFGAFRSSVDFKSNLDETVFGVGNNDIVPANNWTAQVRYERRWGTRGSFILDVSRKEIDDLLGRVVIRAPIPSNPKRTFEITDNVGRATSTAIESKVEIPLDRWFVGGLFSTSIVARDSTTIDPVTHTEHALNNQNPLEWHASLSRSLHEGSDFSWSIYVDGPTSSISYSPRSVNEFEWEGRIGANVSWQARRDLSLTFGVNNLTTLGNHSRYVFYDQPRDVGSPLFREKSQNFEVQSAFVSLRRSF